MKKENDIKVSIVIPVYNSEKTIGKCLKSLVNQTYENIEIICVNDCSKDNSLSVLKHYAAKDHRIVVINHAENMNAGGARNSGIRAAKGDYICFVDNDDWLREDAIDVLVQSSDNGYYDIVVPQWYEAFEDGTLNEYTNYVLGTDRELCIQNMWFNGGGLLGLLFRRSMIIEHEIFYPEKLFWEDNAIHACFILACKTMIVIPDRLYYYRIVAQSSSRSITFRKIEDRIKSSDLFIENIRKKFPVQYDQYRNEIEWSYLYRFISVIDYLAEFPYKQSAPVLKVVQCKTQRCMPNKYFDKFDCISQKKLLYPIKYVKQEKKKQYIQDIRKSLRRLIHKLTTFVKFKQEKYEL